MQGLFSVLAMIYELMTYGANVEYSPHINNPLLARVLLYIIIFMRSLSYVGHPLCTLLLDFITVASPSSG